MAASGHSRVRGGLDRVAAGDPEVLRVLRGRKLGLLAHPASVDCELRHARDVLSAAGCEVTVLFGPEHGFGGEAQDMAPVQSEAEASTTLAVHSLYGSDERDLYPRPEWLQGLDAVVIDMQDVGSRYYTFVWTAVCMLRAASAAGVQSIVLDRPNPLGGDRVEGAVQREGYRSFVGLRDVAVRHGMTIGELCVQARDEEGIALEALHVVRMQGYARSMQFPDTGLPWVLPSPNMPTYDTAVVYPGGCLLEGTNLSEGRGTTRPFEIWGAPFLDGAELARRVHAPGVVLRPLSFQPTFQKHGRTRCGGVQVHVLDAEKLKPYELYLQLIAATAALCPGEFDWRREPYEFVSDRLAIDLLTGGPEFREAVDGGAGIDAVVAAERAGAVAFDEARRPYLLY